MRRDGRIAATGVLLAALIAGCGSGAPDGPPPGSAAGAPDPAAELTVPAGAEAAGSGAAADLSAKAEPIALALRRTTVAGRAVEIVTSNGRTLYRFEGDDHDPAGVNCLDDCVVTWPPVLLSADAPSLDGIPASAVGTVTRADGQRQVTIGGWPMYYFVEDRNPGDLLGEGLAGNWSVVTADGKAVVKKSGRPELEPAP